MLQRQEARQRAPTMRVSPAFHFPRALRFVVAIVCVALNSWAAAAIYFDSSPPAMRKPLAFLYVAALICVWILAKRRHRATVISFAAFTVVLIWWLHLPPSNNRAWQPDVRETPWAERDGDQVTIHNVRNCEYRTETDYIPRWETRTVSLSEIRGIDLFITYWGSPSIAHPIVSFQIGDHDHLAFSIETRKEVGETYSALRGFFRQYELIYVVADERDVVRLRSNYRKGEQVYLYHTRVTPEQARLIFLDYLRSANELHEHPEWYNAVTSNCTTNIRVHAAAGVKPKLWNWRLLLNGYADRMLYDRGNLAGDLPFDELKRRALINPAARAADKDPDFSTLIRKNRPGFEGIAFSDLLLEKNKPEMQPIGVRPHTAFFATSGVLPIYSSTHVARRKQVALVLAGISQHWAVTRV
jgi:Domain of unknown function (DUF4105)